MIERAKSPPLNALRAFEAAARLESFTAAALELSVTPGAVAQQIKSLESWIGSELFLRHAKGVDLSPVGKEVLPNFISAFDSLSEAVHALMAEAKPHHIRIAALPAIAQLWLSPLLPLVREKMPEITTSIAALEAPPNLARETYDISLFFQRMNGGAGQTVVADDVIYPVCTPRFAEKLTRVEDLGSVVLLVDAAWSNDWDLWLSEQKMDLSGPMRKAEFSLYSLALEEAKNGAGVLMAHEALVRPLLNAGSLVCPFDYRTKLDRKLVLSLSKAGSANPFVQKLVEVLVSPEKING